MKLFAGFVSGKIATTPFHTDEGAWDAPELFSKRKHAQIYFEDVREVEIVEVKKVRGSKRPSIHLCEICYLPDGLHQEDCIVRARGG